MTEILSVLAFCLLVAAQLLAVVYCGRINAQERGRDIKEEERTTPASFWHRFVDL